MTLEQNSTVPHHLPVRGHREVLRTPAPRPCSSDHHLCLSLSHLLVLSVPNTLAYPMQTGAACYFIFCRAIQNLYILPIFGAGDPSSKLGPVLCATLEK